MSASSRPMSPDLEEEAEVAVVEAEAEDQVAIEGFGGRVFQDDGPSQRGGPGGGFDRPPVDQGYGRRPFDGPPGSAGGPGSQPSLGGPGMNAGPGHGAGLPIQ
ncbi:hypothetical protein J008_05609 [Cryptococcus neoformans]|uniref:Uncharacterized protein n=1 Tax=Cryptococcus neoformans (strain H99 / ATCC 208821 / CBS 10515 / FGSC 9487) TaxID=235443 RepID=J9VYD4_CRYN9|nr:hypothetical protein CNAG_04558 [Cryptococcus neoformans var. grubii H99]AUB27705.1 hypothetical protein CKF44_04558 [Cryptococcus neoformans var. grubii]OWT36475.1 hypothetical protein C362_05879 [Cryptococcus neoformans var. grubii Bt1]OWZ28263.1 hypothetical protein C347_05844 [Cryptococcus neoformans var. grubii AD2-60a]OWZ33061.1 hypothetical protein C353_05702 [Cryptococcus neoformans var. grubii AD1-83a]OWZ40578.1 hypothetical protein C343_05806 [Cryptococcus neoformans var. grubii C|eukprot:XP_012052061.1 hypothetical protein CNAG_04558 [Cryptococcus neoformans var. grubii H99]